MKSKRYFKVLALLFITLIFMSCKYKNKTKSVNKNTNDNALFVEKLDGVKTPEGMVWVKGKTFIQGAKAGDVYAMQREMPGHKVAVDGFFIDITEVTNKQFNAFVEATGYITIAERPINWDEMKKDLPADTPKPDDSILQPGSLIFNKDIKEVANMGDYRQWWRWQIGANWKHPEGPKSSIDGKDNYPVVHVAFDDALEYCKWAKRRLPTESEWEAAAQGNSIDAVYTWGNNPELLNEKANTWQGVFPVNNESKDGFKLIAPVKSYTPNSIGIYDMLGNVWEHTSDFFNVNYYKELDSTKVLKNPKGAEKSFSPSNPYQQEHVIKGGSFLCHASYCASFRISAKMGVSTDSGSDHTGFRTVVTIDMIENQ
jgi:formylglycine-generating enzyme required for sulfatase activity